MQIYIYIYIDSKDNGTLYLKVAKLFIQLQKSVL